jgi:hypothetical protein
MADLSTQNACGIAQRVATALLRATGGAAACLRMPPLNGDSSDQGQLGLDAPGFLSLPLSPAVLRGRPRGRQQEGEAAQYELLVAAETVSAQVSELKLSSAEALFAQASGVVVGGKLFLIESVTTAQSQGAPYLYRLLLRETVQSS